MTGKPDRTELDRPAFARPAARLAGMAALLTWGICGLPHPVRAQSSAAPVPTVSRPVVQPLPNQDGFVLDQALSRLASNPRDVNALVDAGHAALAMGDVDAATGFFKRAAQVAPGNGRAKAGLASALLRSGNPIEAIPLFMEAEKAGTIDPSLVSDRGLAYDLVGDNAAAQECYRRVLANGADELASRRLAVSLAIAGDRRGSEAALLPQLRAQDKSAWRSRAFALAILGDSDQAVTIVKTILPADLATAVAPYLRYMPRLTPAQQAAAANFGNFPLPSEIGRDDPRIAQYAPPPGSRGKLATADAALIPQGEPLGRKERARRERREREQQKIFRAAAARASESRAARVAPPEVKPVIGSAAEVAAAAATPAASSASRSMSGQVVASAVPAPGFDLASIAEGRKSQPAPAGTAPVSTAVPATVPATEPERPSLAEAFSDFRKPAADIAPAAGAVDIRRITPARPKPKAEARTASPPEAKKPPPPSHPSRIWVQVATGRDKRALGFDWRRILREGGNATKGKRGFVSAWGQTNRLLTGPFESEAAANAFIQQLRRAGVDGPFVWTSPAGQIVDALPAR